jgi:hypothetical protein
VGGRFYLKEQEGEGRGRVWEFMTESLGVIVSDIFLLITNYEREIIICPGEGLQQGCGEWKREEDE